MNERKRSKLATSRLCKYVVKLIKLYESKLGSLVYDNDSSAQSHYEEISSVLNNLVKLLSQLNKLNKDHPDETSVEELEKRDNSIINVFLKNVKK